MGSLTAYLQLMRLHRPIGIFLVLWPTLWALWLAAEGIPPLPVLAIFCAGAVVMRSAGCVINDLADQKYDGQVQRTKGRPLVTGAASRNGAWSVFVFLILLAAILVWQTNRLTQLMALGALALAAVYPLMKRYTHMPQLVLGAAFAWAVPMAFTAVNNSLDPRIGLVYITVLMWTVMYDTFYAMVDRADDLRAGVKSTAVLLGDADRAATAALQIAVLVALWMIGRQFELSDIYNASLILVAGLFGYQQVLIRDREPGRCFRAFLNNNWVGLVVFAGIAAHYYLSQ